MGVIYAAQANVTTVSELKKMYESLTNKTQEAGEHKHQIIVLGNFNAKVGATIIQSSKETITKGQRLLSKMVEKENMSLVNADKHKCRGLWPREQGKENSINVMQNF